MCSVTFKNSMYNIYACDGRLKHIFCSSEELPRILCFFGSTRKHDFLGTPSTEERTWIESIPEACRNDYLVKSTAKTVYEVEKCAETAMARAEHLNEDEKVEMQKRLSSKSCVEFVFLWTGR